MITAWLTVIALCCVIIAAAVLRLAALGVRAACCWVRDWWGRARDVIRLTQDEAELSSEPVPYWPACPCPPGCRCPLSPPDAERAFGEHAETALRVVSTEDADEFLKWLMTQEGTEQ
jgi:hypothetical protein